MGESEDENEDENVPSNISDDHYFDEMENFSEQKKQVATTLTHLVMPQYYQEFALIQEGLGKLKIALPIHSGV